MKNSFCRICRGRFNLKYPPAAVVCESQKSIPPRSIAVRIAEGGETSENICWDCEETLLGFHKSIGEDNEDEEETVVVDDDEILYKSLEKTKRIHRLSQKTEIIQIDSSDSDPEEIVIIPQDEVMSVETANQIFGRSKKDSDSLNQNKQSDKKKTPCTMISKKNKTNIPRGKVFESKHCPLCPYHSGIEYEVVFHIRQTHPQYNGDDLRFDTKEGDSILTRRIVFAHLWTFFECKECGKLYDRFWPHRKHITTHDRKHSKNGMKKGLTLNNNKICSPPKQIHNGKSLKRPFDEMNGLNKSSSNVRVKLFKTSNNNHSNKVNEKTLVIKLHKSESEIAVNKQKSQSEKSKSKALLRKQQQLQARRERKRQKLVEEKKAALKNKAKVISKAIPKPTTKPIPKPTFKMPTQPAPRASSIVKPIVQKISFICKLCSKIFPSFLGWNSHMIRYHRSDEFKEQNDAAESICKICDKHFDDASILQKHTRFSHRRKNRNLNKEVNGNDKVEICCQSPSQMLKKEESKDDEQLTESSPLPSNESGSTAIEEPHNSLLPACALFCEYCGSLFGVPETMKDHKSSHVANGEVKRFFVTKFKV